MRLTVAAARTKVPPLLWPLSRRRKRRPQWRAGSSGAKRPPTPAGGLVDVPKNGASRAPGQQIKASPSCCTLARTASATQQRVAHS